MQETDIFIKLIITVVFGAVLGLESETREIEKKGEKKAEQEEQQKIGGFRTYTLISLFGGIAGLLYIQKLYELAYIIFISLILFLITAYYLNVKLKQAFGLTTEIAIIITFVLGFLTTSSLVRFEFLFAILVLMAFFLSQKRAIGKIIHKIEHKEIIDLIEFGLIAMIVLPLLPNQDFLLKDIVTALNIKNIELGNFSNLFVINPFQIWTIVVIVSGFNLFSYSVTKFIGQKKGILFSSVLTGLISSTSAIISYATKSKHKDNTKSDIKVLAGASLIANGVSFILVGLLILVINSMLFERIFLSLLFMFVAGVVTGLYLITSTKTSEGLDNNHKIIKYEPFSIMPAIKFVIIILVLTVVIQVFQILQFNESLVVLFTALSGVTGMDASSIAISNLAINNSITIQLAALGFILTNSVNFIAKGFYAKTLGSVVYFKYILVGLVISTLFGLIGLFAMFM
jgi:uncharacterized membrane protein (DUF4010 family)